MPPKVTPTRLAALETLRRVRDGDLADRALERAAGDDPRANARGHLDEEHVGDVGPRGAVLAEMVAGNSGIGFYVLNAQRSFLVPEMYAGVIALARAQDDLALIERKGLHSWGLPRTA